MEWIIYSLIMFGFSILQYMVLRKLQKMKIPSIINTLMLFLPAVPMFIVLGMISGKSLLLSLPITLFIIVTTYLFSYLGNIFSIRGIKNAPNSGYALVIQKSYAIYTTFAAVILFGSTINLKSVIAILIVIVFSLFIIIERREKDQKKSSINHWIIPSLLAFFLFGNLSLTSKWLLTQGIDPLVRTMYVFLIVSIMYGVNFAFDIKNGKVELPKRNWTIITLLIIMGLSNGLFNLFMQLGYDKAPNIGYVNIFNAASIMPITLLSALIFKDNLNRQKIIGIIGVTAGIILLII